jgi:hypothetical protein
LLQGQVFAAAGDADFGSEDTEWEVPRGITTIKNKPPRSRPPVSTTATSKKVNLPHDSAEPPGETNRPEITQHDLCSRGGDSVSPILRLRVSDPLRRLSTIPKSYMQQLAMYFGAFENSPLIACEK